MQKVLIMWTEGKGMFRDKAVGWSCEDGDSLYRSEDVEFKNGIMKQVASKKPISWKHEEIGKVPAPEADFNFVYQAPLFALSDGWNLLAPPRKDSEDQWEWWFTKNYG